MAPYRRDTLSYHCEVVLDAKIVPMSLSDSLQLSHTIPFLVPMKRTNFNSCNLKGTNDSMASAYILISSEIGYETIIIDELLTIPQALEAHKVYGSAYDIIAKISADSPEKLRRILSNIRRVEKIKSTQTMLVVEGHA